MGLRISNTVFRLLQSNSHQVRNSLQNRVSAVFAENLFQIRQVDLGCNKKVVRFTTPEPLFVNPEAAEELFEIARLFHEQHPDALQRFKGMPQAHKQEVFSHLQRLGAKAQNLHADPFKTEQALIATGLQEQRYFNQHEMQEWFADLEQCMAADIRKSELIFLRP